MLWWFEREGQQTRVEILHLPGGGGYELRIIAADGTEHVEFFVTHQDLMNRQQAVLDQLIATGWHRSAEWLL